MTDKNIVNDYDDCDELMLDNVNAVSLPDNPHL